MLAVVDHGLGNLRSIVSALEKLGIDHRATVDPQVLSQANGVILPGVGAFPDGMASLRRLGLVDVLNDLVLRQARPILGICLGFQLMAKVGFEFQREAGLGWFDAEVVRLDASQVRIPHVGWNDCTRTRESELFTDIPPDGLFYFTHSYHVVLANKGEALATSDHGISFTAAAQRANIFGVQFHPEKSQQHGLKLLENFARRTAC